MSRVDEALRRARLDQAELHSSAGSEPAAVAVDDSTLAQYAAERQSGNRDGARDRPLTPGPRTTAPPAPRTAAPPTPRIVPPPRERFTAFHASLEGRLVTSRETSAISVEQYRRLAASLHAAQAERGLKTLMVSSSVSNEGKTLTVTNLSLTSQ
jgi:Mrp family chromosome partitioning ATPase